MFAVSFILQIVALVLLFAASLNVTTSKVALFPLGMALWLLSLMLGAVALHPIGH